jgi:hypothetical protein
MSQLIQVSIDDAFLCEINYDYKEEKFFIEWAKDSFVEDLMVTFNPYRSIMTWVKDIERYSGLVINHINVCEIIDYGKDVNVMEDGKEFCEKNRMIDIVPPKESVKVYQMEFFTN